MITEGHYLRSRHPVMRPNRGGDLGAGMVEREGSRRVVNAGSGRFRFGDRRVAESEVQLSSLGTMRKSNR